MTVQSRLILTLAAISLLVAACGADPDAGTTTTIAPSTTTAPTTTTTPDVACSAARANLDRPGAVSGVPQAVADMREAIVTAALACDIDELARLALAGDRPFTASFGGGDPAELWRDAEARGENLTADLVRILAMSWGTQETQFETDVPTSIWFWPAAFGDDANDADWAEVSVLYSAAEIAQMKDFGGYIGWRAGFTEDGDWVFFIAGD